MTRWRVIQGLLLLLLPSFLISCMGRTSGANPIYYYTIDYEPRPTFYAVSLPVVLRVHRFSVSPPFNSQRMIYADNGMHRNGYGYHQWIASPGELLPFVLARDLKYSGALQTILTPDATLPATHELHGWVEKFVEQDNSSSCNAFARLHITLKTASGSDPSQSILLQESYQARSPLKGKKPGDFALAMSQAVAQIYKAVIEDLYRQLSSGQTPNP